MSHTADKTLVATIEVRPRDTSTVLNIRLADGQLQIHPDLLEHIKSATSGAIGVCYFVFDMNGNDLDLTIVPGVQHWVEIPGRKNPDRPDGKFPVILEEEGFRPADASGDAAITNIGGGTVDEPTVHRSARDGSII